MINLELILGASVVTERCDYFDAAINHARSEVLGHVEASGFVHHDVVFNKVTGDVVTTLAGQVIRAWPCPPLLQSRKLHNLFLKNRRNQYILSKLLTVFVL